MNQLFYGDNLEVMQKYIADESVDLCYIDPPFNSDANYNQIYNTNGVVDKAQAQAFVDTWSWDDAANEGLKNIVTSGGSHYSRQTIELILALERVLGKSDLLAYLVSMTQRVQEIYRVLKPTGSFYLHCDIFANYLLRMLLDTIFVSQGGKMLNEIVWRYRTYQGQVKNYFPRKHDTIFFYSKSNKTTFHLLKDNIPANAIDFKRWNKYLNKNNEITGDNYPKTDSRFNGYIKRFIKENGREPNKNDVIFKIEGQTIDSVWDIKAVDPKSKDKLGYETQKPEELLERIIKASSNEGDVVLDAFCGCGTTVAVAQRLNRKWIGIDITYNAVSLILKRMEDTFGTDILEQIQLTGIPKDFKGAKALAEKKDDRLRKEFEKWAILTYTNNRGIINEDKGGDGGIDGLAYILDLDKNNDQKYNKIILQVKTGKSLTPSIIRDLDSVVNNKDGVMGVLITLYSADNLVREAKKYGTYKNNLLTKNYDKIQVINIVEVMEGARLDMPVLDMLKSAERKHKTIQLTMGEK